jgi:HEPN domain-containing protein
MKKETEVWLTIAKEDYKNMCAMKESKSLRGAVLFAQQCVEKVIKAYIVEHTKESPKKIHHLEKLIQDANLDLKEINSPKIDELSKAYGWARYPDLSSSHFKTQEQVEPLLLIAETVYQWVLNKFKTV